MCFRIKKSVNEINMNGPPHPFSDNGVFSQLKRVDPSLELPEIFDHGSAQCKGPPLPSRSSDLILHREWHVKGNCDLSKRIRRVTEEQTGSEELSRMISSARESVDRETNQFCKAFSENSMLRYETALLKGARSEPFSRPIGSKTSEGQPVSLLSSRLDLSIDLDNVVTPPTSPPTLASTKSNDSSECLEESVIDALFANLSSLEHHNGKQDLVDMEDDKVTELWQLSHGVSHPPSICIPISGTKHILNGNVGTYVPISEATKFKAPEGENCLQGLFNNIPMQCVFIAKSDDKTECDEPARKKRRQSLFNNIPMHCVFIAKSA